MAAGKTIMQYGNTLSSTISMLMFAWKILRQYYPYQLRPYVQPYIRRFIAIFNPYIEISINEFTRNYFARSDAYITVEAYLEDISSKDATKFTAEMGRGGKRMKLSMDEHEEVTDVFEGVTVWWNSYKLASSSLSLYPDHQKRYYTLKFHKRYREIITETYLTHVLTKGKEIIRSSRQKKLYTNSAGQKQWSHIPFEHPATFESIAMDPEKKQEIIDDLLTFNNSKDFYARIGKTWKRGYLLYGPPGTGKSTMIAAMANLLNYDVYDLELTTVNDNTELKKLLTETTSKAIIVIEDIDCSLDLTGKRKKKVGKPTEKDKKKETTCSKETTGESSNKVTLSGLLNFIDGLWSSSGGQRIIVFTTNHVQKLDPALTRRGRMDKHIELSYCSFEAFKVLAKNYLEIEEHPMFDQIKQLMEETNITPADVAENLMPKTATTDAEICLSNLVQALEEEQKKPKKVEAMQGGNQEPATEVEI